MSGKRVDFDIPCYLHIIHNRRVLSVSEHRFKIPNSFMPEALLGISQENQVRESCEKIVPLG
jgi:hypothetical protein